MGWGHEEATQESSRCRSRQVRWISPERGQKASQPRKWPQGRPGQKPQEENCLAAQRAAPTAGETREEGVSAAVASIRARFGYRAIGLGYGGIRYPARGRLHLR
jgi:hypothetical protein